MKSRCHTRDMRKRRFSLMAFLVLVDPLGEGSSWTSFHARTLRRTTQPNKPSPSPQSSLHLKRLASQHSGVETNGSNVEMILNFAIARLWRLRAMSFLNPPLIIARRVSFDSTGLLATSCPGRRRRHQRCFGAAKRENEARLVNGYAVTPAGNGPDSLTRPAWGVGGNGSVRPEIPKWKHKAVIIPG